MTASGVPDPLLTTVYDFGAVAALYSVAERLGVCRVIDEVAGKRKQGLPVSSSILLAAINRAVAPVSKKSFFEWFDKTVLYKMFPAANEKNLSSQGFWNNMEFLDEKKIGEIEDALTKVVVDCYNLDVGCLLFDNTNFFTYMDTSNPSELAKRSHSKEKRTDLKIVGLSLMVSPDHNIPLYHEVYPGNRHDATQFNKIISKLKARYQKLGRGDCVVTLVFDKGNNNDGNIADLISTKPCQFHFVGGLRLNQCPELLEIPRSDYALLGEPLSGIYAYRATKSIYGSDFETVITYNPELFKAQMEGIAANIATCEKKLEMPCDKLEKRRSGQVTKGKKPTAESVEKNIRGILSADHMRELFRFTITEGGKKIPTVDYSFDDESFLRLQDRVLGKSILFTDHGDWSSEQVVAAYHSQFHVEEDFKQMKDTKYLSFRPIRHFTDKHIVVHAFYCVLGLLLASVLNKELDLRGTR